MNAISATPLPAAPAHVPPHLIHDFDYINDPQLILDPHARMRSLIAEAPPVFYSRWYGGHWVVTRKKDLIEVTGDPATFSNKSRGLPPIDRDITLIPLTMDPPEHTKYRMPLNAYFSPKGIAHLEVAIRQMTNDLIDKVIDQGRCDFLHDAAEPLPVTLFMKMAGMPTDRLKEFRQLAEDATAAPEASTRFAAFQRIGEILASVVKERQAKREDDLISLLLDARIDGHPPSFEEVVNYSVLLFLGGLETVVNALGFTARHLAQDQELQASLRADPSLIPQTIEEMLRLYGIASSIRVAKADRLVGEAPIQAGDSVLLLIPAANYDPAAFAEPAACCPGRPEPHVTFNSGPHRCLGANLARLELRSFFDEWFKRVPPFRLDPENPPVFFGGLNLAVRNLPLIW